jgi:iron uptake system component EfeO
MSRISRLACLASLVLSSACSSSGGDSPGAAGQSAKTDEQWKIDVTGAIHASILGDVDALVRATEDLQAAAPAPAGRGWDRDKDADAIANMKAAWARARAAYEHIEGAIAPTFPEIDAAIDERYDGFLEALGPAGDPDPFDGEGVTGMHAVERILWSDAIPARVTDFERTIPGYKAAAFPATEGEANAFKTKLVGKLVSDAKSLRAQWAPQKIDVASVWDGLVGLVNEQREKVSNASEGAEESRYSQLTMRDIRANLDGTKKIYDAFAPWIGSKDGGKDVDGKVRAAFGRFDALYAAVQGDAIPAPPPTWSAERPSESDLGTPFGRLYAGVKDEADATKPASAAAAMNACGKVLGFPAR